MARLAAARTELASVDGIDLNGGMLAVAAAATAGAANTRWHQADASAALPLEDESVDVVYCQQGLQFFSDQTRGLREMHRVLARGGRVALATWRPIEHNPAFGLLIEALAKHVGPEAAKLLRAPCSGPSPVRLRQLLTDAGFGPATIRIGFVHARFSSPREYLRRQVAGSPLSGLVDTTEAAQWEAVTEELDQTLLSYTDDDGLVLPMQTWLTTAHRSGDVDE